MLQTVTTWEDNNMPQTATDVPTRFFLNNREGGRRGGGAHNENSGLPCTWYGIHFVKTFLHRRFARRLHPLPPHPPPPPPPRPWKNSNRLRGVCVRVCLACLRGSGLGLGLQVASPPLCGIYRVIFHGVVPGACSEALSTRPVPAVIITVPPFP